MAWKDEKDSEKIRLTTSEARFAKEKLDEIARCSKVGVAVVYKYDGGGQRRIQARYTDGRVAQGHVRTGLKDWPTLFAVKGFLAHLVKAGRWEPYQPKHPLQLLAEQAEEEEALEESAVEIIPPGEEDPASPPRRRGRARDRLRDWQRDDRVPDDPFHRSDPDALPF